MVVAVWAIAKRGVFGTLQQRRSLLNSLAVDKEHRKTCPVTFTSTFSLAISHMSSAYLLTHGTGPRLGSSDLYSLVTSVAQASQQHELSTSADASVNNISESKAFSNHSA